MSLHETIGLPTIRSVPGDSHQGYDFSREQCEAEVTYEGFSLGFFRFTLTTSDDVMEILFICSTH